jgi:hypothetical protein
MSTLDDDELRRLAAAYRALSMSKRERTSYLTRKGWRNLLTRAKGGFWVHPDGRSLPTLQAVEAQLLEDLRAGS